MTPRLPPVQPRLVVRALERDGWMPASQRGSHIKLRKPGQGVIIVPLHRHDMPRGTLAAILADAGITPERFLELLRG